MKYEITLVECMHGIANHIDNILVELPNHIKSEGKVKMIELLAVLNKEKETKRCCDKRKILLQVTKCLQYKIDGNVYKLLRTLCEMQRTLYLGDDFRTPKEILRLHNASFEHFVLLKKLINLEKLSSKMTRDKLYGKYKHNLLVRAPRQYHLVSGEAINCEDEERVFKLIRNIVHCNSNNSQGHLIGNLIVRLEVESRCTERYEFDSSNNSTVSGIHNLGANLHADERNSLFTYEFIQENSADWRSHLEKVSDFLIFENKWWKKSDFGIEYFDFVNEPENRDQHPKVHHFRSSNINVITSELVEHWHFIVENNICIPTHEILQGDGEEMVRYTSTPFLADKILCDSPSFRKVPSSLMEDEDEELENDFPDFQYFEAEPMILNLEETFLEIVSCEETPQGDFETTLEATLETTLENTLETDNKVMLESVSGNIHEKLTSTVLSSH